MTVRLRTLGETCNLEFILSDHDWEAGLRKVLLAFPDWVALQEALNHRDDILNRVCSDLGYAWARAEGGEPILWRVVRYGDKPRWVHPVLLARAEFVGHIPGRKDRLPASIATEVGLDDLWRKHPDGAVTVVLDYHMTAEVQDVRGGNGYKKDPRHLLRVLRHRREKRRLGQRMRIQKRRGREVYGAGDGNFAGMQIGGFVNCWEGRHGGDLGGRPVSIIFADSKPSDLQTIPTPSDHDTVVATY
jgi:hypothetical protein